MIDGVKIDVPVFLASVKTPEEARLALANGADVIDCKDPQKGALGALSAPAVQAIVEAIGGRALVSATAGDLPSDPGVMVKAATLIAAAGVDFVKAGFFGDADPRDAIAALGKAALGRARLVAVLMADRNPDFEILAALRAAGFAGVMLDTADKSGGALPDVMPVKSLSRFIDAARQHGLSAGLAGSLRLEHIAGIAALGPDVIGFRGALCDGGRTGALDAARIAAVRTAIDATSLRKRHAAKRIVA